MQIIASVGLQVTTGRGVGRQAADTLTPSRSRGANRPWWGLLLAAVVAVLLMLFGAGTASAATATAAQTRVGASMPAAPFLVRPNGGIGAGQRVGNDLPAYDFVLATDVAAKVQTIQRRPPLHRMLKQHRANDNSNGAVQL